MTRPKIVLFDLEIIPNLPKALEYWCELSCRWETKTLKATITSIVCAGYKIYGEKETHCINAWDYTSWDKDVNDDYTVCAEIYEVLKDADAIVTHNGIKFDLPYLQTRLKENGLPFLPKLHHIDSLKIVKKNLYMINNKLNTLGKLLAGEQKLAHTGWKLWVDTHNKCPKALALMERYCKQDVNLLEKCFKELLPLIQNMPNRNLWRSVQQIKDGTNVCPNCGSEHIKSNGWRSTKTMAYRRIVCIDCGTWSRTDTKERKPRTY